MRYESLEESLVSWPESESSEGQFERGVFALSELTCEPLRSPTH